MKAFFFKGGGADFYKKNAMNTMNCLSGEKEM